jgi:hypothetical protein
MKMEIKYHATYRIGKCMHEPRHRIGTEIDETTSLSFGSFIDETELLLGNPISLLWFGRTPMPERCEKCQI